MESENTNSTRSDFAGFLIGMALGYVLSLIIVRAAEKISDLEIENTLLRENIEIAYARGVQASKDERQADKSDEPSSELKTDAASATTVSENGEEKA